MKTPRFLLPVLLFLAVTRLSALEPPVLQQLFNDLGNVDFVNGAVLGDAGSGVSGKPEDKAYTAPDSRPEDAVQPAGIIPNAELPQTMQKATVTVWYKLRQPPRDAITLVDAGPFYLLWQGDNRGAWNMRLQMPIENKMHAWFNPRNNGTVLPWSSEGEWVFYALTWDSASGEVVVYQGSTKDAAVEQKRFANSEATKSLESVPGVASIGNAYDLKNKKPGTRAIGGSIDNVRIFGAALSAEDIEKVRAADVANSPL